MASPVPVHSFLAVRLPPHFSGVKKKWATDHIGQKRDSQGNLNTNLDAASFQKQMCRF